MLTEQTSALAFVEPVVGESDRINKVNTRVIFVRYRRYGNVGYGE